MNATPDEITFQSILIREFEGRCKRNPRYSLRSFARDLGFAPNRLSEVLKGRYGISRKAAEQIAERLAFPKQEVLYFCDLVDSKHSRSPVQREEAMRRLQLKHQDLQTQYLSLDAFKVISDWYHYAIVELTSTEDFVNDPKWIASRIGIEEPLVSAAIERLVRMGLLETEGEMLRPGSGSTAGPSGVPSDAIRKFHRQVLQKALLAIDNQEIEKRDFSSIVMAIHTQDLPEIKKAVLEFRRSLASTFCKPGPKNEVYCLGIQFFNLSENQTLTRAK